MFSIKPPNKLNFLQGGRCSNQEQFFLRDLFMPLAEAELMILHKPKGQPDMLRGGVAGAPERRSPGVPI